MHKAKKNILIVDDDANFCLSLEQYLQGEDAAVHVAASARECLALCSKNRMDVLLLDQKLPDAEGHTLCPSILGWNNQTKIIFMTAFPSFDNAVSAVRAGAFDYLSKPFELEELDLAIQKALRTLDLERVEQFQNYRMEREREGTILIGESEQVVQIRQLIDMASRTDAPVLITGETGSGKNVVARAIHYQGPFRSAPFVSINCAALPETLTEAELFGYEKGAFTGAAAMKKGMFEIAEGGTILLDEIGEMPTGLQAKLLGVLDDRSFRRLGGTALLQAQVRVIAATSLDLEKAIWSRTFRQDLYYRLGVLRIQLPPLRERKRDIPELCGYLTAQLARGRSIRIQEHEIDKLMRYDWPGNIRELRNVLERALIIQQGEEIRPTDLLGASHAKPALPVKGGTQQTLAEPSASLDEIEKEHILAALAEQGGNYSRTARALGISLSTLKRKLKKYLPA